jgi:hypothetical protein
MTLHKRFRTMKAHASPGGRDEQRMRWNAFVRDIASAAYRPSNTVLLAGLGTYSYVADAVELAVLAASPKNYVPEDDVTNPYRHPDDDGVV